MYNSIKKQTTRKQEYYRKLYVYNTDKQTHILLCESNQTNRMCENNKTKRSTQRKRRRLATGAILSTLEIYTICFSLFYFYAILYTHLAIKKSFEKR